MENWNPHYHDCYFTPGEGINESRHVFYQGNDLHTRLPAALTGRDRTFTIIETGFGSGLNALVTLIAASRLYPPLQGTLSFFSVDKYPLNSNEMMELIASELREPTAEDANPKPTGTPAGESAGSGPAPAGYAGDGARYLELCGMLPDVSRSAEESWTAASIPLGPSLTAEVRVYRGEVGDYLSDLSARGIQADAFFLDGHSPDLNPDMWSPDVFAACARLAAPDAVLATYTAAGLVKRGLRSVGFSVVRRPGFGRKRHMVRASRPLAENAAAEDGAAGHYATTAAGDSGGPDAVPASTGAGRRVGRTEVGREEDSHA